MSDCSRAAAEISDVHYRVCVLGGGRGYSCHGEKGSVTGPGRGPSYTCFCNKPHHQACGCRWGHRLGMAREPGLVSLGSWRFFW